MQDTVLYAGCADGNIYIHDTRSKDAVRILKEHTECILCTGVHENYLFSGADDKKFVQWDIRQGKVMHTFFGHSDTVRCLSITTDGSLYTGSFDHSVRRWDMDAVINKFKHEEEIRKQAEEQKKAEADAKKSLKKKKTGGKKKKKASGEKKKSSKKKKK